MDQSLKSKNTYPHVIFKDITFSLKYFKNIFALNKNIHIFAT